MWKNQPSKNSKPRAKEVQSINLEKKKKIKKKIKKENKKIREKNHQKNNQKNFIFSNFEQNVSLDLCPVPNSQQCAKSGNCKCSFSSEFAIWTLGRFQFRAGSQIHFLSFILIVILILFTF